MRRRLTAAACAGLAACTVLLAAPARADDDPPPGEAGAEFVLLAADDESYAPYEAEGCGTTLTHSSGDVREIEAAAASPRTARRSRSSGAASPRTSAHRTAARWTSWNQRPLPGRRGRRRLHELPLRGPDHLPGVPGEEAAYAAAGLPVELYAAGGALELVTGPDGAGAEFLAVPQVTADVCALLDGAAVPLPTAEDDAVQEPPAGYVALAPDDPFYTTGSSVADCGTVLAVTSGDVREVETGTVVEEDGSVVVRSRGAATLDVRDVGRGVVLDELAASGRTLGVHDDADDHLEFDVDEDGDLTVTDAPTDFLTVCDLFDE